MVILRNCGEPQIKEIQTEDGNILSGRNEFVKYFTDVGKMLDPSF